MARFKFGKHKKKPDGSDVSVTSSIDYLKYDAEPEQAASSYQQQQQQPNPPPQQLPPQPLHYQQQSPPKHFEPESAYAANPQNLAAVPVAAPGLNTTTPNPGAHASELQSPASPSVFQTPKDHFDSILDPRSPQKKTQTSASGSLSPWKRHKLFNSPFPRYRHAASAFSSEKNEIFLMGGLKDGSVFGDTWKITPQLDEDNNLSFVSKNVEIANNTNPPARVGHSSVLCGNAFIIHGGDTVDTDFNGFPDNNFYLFNINNCKYTVPLHILNKPHGRYGHTIGVIALNNSSSRLYLFGGQLENDVFNDLYYFELNTFKSPKARWETVEPLNNFKPPPLTNHSMCVHKNRIYIFGGVYNNEKVSNDLWCFDAIINKWTQVNTTGAIPLPVNEHSTCLVNDKMYIYGGNDFLGTIYDSLYVLDLHTLVWSKLIESEDVLRNGPGPRCGHSITFLQSYKKLIIMGGDKNDYIDSNPNNFDTYEDFNGQDIGTMIFELDLASLDNFLSDKPQAKTKTSVLKKITAKKEQQQQKQLELEQLHLKQQQDAEVPEPIEKDIAEEAQPPAVPPITIDRESRSHMRSHSNGPEDFRTPNGSPAAALGLGDKTSSAGANIAAGAAAAAVVGASVGAYSHYTENDDNFVDFEHNEHDDDQSSFTQRSSVLPAPSILEDKQGEDGTILKKLPEVSSYHNGHASFLDTYKDGESIEQSNTPPVEEEDARDQYKSVANSQTEHETSHNSISYTGGTAKSVNVAPVFNTGGVRNGSGLESSEVKKIVSELTNELNNLKSSTAEQINEASHKISQLELQNSELKTANEQFLNFDTEIRKYKEAIAERDSIIQGLRSDAEKGQEEDEGSVSRSISEINQYKLERLELNNKLVYYEKENSTLKDKMEKFEPFMNNQITELSNFQRVIKQQEDKIDKLSLQVKNQEQLQKDILEWKHKFESLEVEYNNYRSIHTDDVVEVSDNEIEEEDLDLVDSPNLTTRSILSTATGRRKKDISSHLESLVHLWSASKASPVPPNAHNKSIITESGEEVSVDPLVEKLQNQVQELLSISKEQQVGSSKEINDLRNELTGKLQSLKEFETNYRDALQSVNNTSRALDSTNIELDKQKELAKKLLKENEELKLYQKASKRVSSRNITPISEIAENEEENEHENGEHEDIKSAHYNMKIQDLQADLFIMKQERDQLKDDVTGLKKQLYLQSQKNN